VPRAFLGDGDITLRATGDSALGKLGFGTTLHGATKAVEITCDVRIQGMVEMAAKNKRLGEK
jgi:hypothetical protein